MQVQEALLIDARQDIASQFLSSVSEDSSFKGEIASRAPGPPWLGISQSLSYQISSMAHQHTFMLIQMQHDCSIVLMELMCLPPYNMTN